MSDSTGWGALRDHFPELYAGRLKAQADAAPRHEPLWTRPGGPVLALVAYHPDRVDPDGGGPLVLGLRPLGQVADLEELAAACARARRELALEHPGAWIEEVR